eukprot:3915132-Rhodomonas_salina.1
MQGGHAEGNEEVGSSELAHAESDGKKGPHFYEASSTDDGDENAHSRADHIMAWQPEEGGEGMSTAQGYHTRVNHTGGITGDDGCFEVASSRKSEVRGIWKMFSKVLPATASWFDSSAKDVGSKRSSSRSLEASSLEELLRSDIFSVMISKMLHAEDLAKLAM